MTTSCHADSETIKSEILLSNHSFLFSILKDPLLPIDYSAALVPKGCWSPHSQCTGHLLASFLLCSDPMVNHFTDILIITHNFLIFDLCLLELGSVAYNRKLKIAVLKVIRVYFSLT